jgi:hypothetical protein
MASGHVVEMRDPIAALLLRIIEGGIRLFHQICNAGGDARAARIACRDTEACRELPIRP